MPEHDTENPETRGEGEDAAPGVALTELPASANSASGKPSPWERLQGEPPIAWELRKVNQALGLAESGALAFLMASLVANGMLQVLGLTGGHIAGFVEVLRYNVFWVAIFGAALAAQSNRLISMDVFARMMPPKIRAYLRIGLAVFTVGVCGLLVDSGLAVRTIASAESYEVIPASVGLFILPLGAGLIAFHVLAHALIDAAYLATGKTAPVEEAPSH